MKKIINNKVYDTATAACVGEWSTRRDDRLYNCHEDLYRKRIGEFFIHGYGGPGSKYAAAEGNNSWSGGEKIIPLTYEAAQKWAQEHLDGDEYEAIFGEVVEDDSRAAVTLSMSVATIERAKRAAAKSNMSLSAYIESLIH